MTPEATATIFGVMPGAVTAAPTKRRPWPLIRHSLVLAKRGVINTIRTPEALIDVTLQPIIFLLIFTYIFGGAIAHGSQHDYLQSCSPGSSGRRSRWAASRSEST
jgi:oleandomycin transport system permease protein